VTLFTSGGLGLGLVSSGLGLGLKNLVLFTSLQTAKYAYGCYGMLAGSNGHFHD